MNNYGFTMIQEKKETSFKKNPATGEFDIPNSYYEQLYKEEITVWIYSNKYKNISEIYFFPENAKNREKLLNAFDFKNWELISKREDFFGTDYIYKVKNLYAMLTSNGNINFYNQKP